MLDIKFIRENPELVKENIRKKYQDSKLPLVDEVIELDTKRRTAIAEADQLRSNRNALSKQIGMLMGQAKKDPSKLEEAEAVKQQVKEQADRLAELEKQETELEAELHKRMLLIPQIIDPSVPLARTTPATWKWSASARPRCPTFPSPITLRLWSPSTALIWTPPAGFPAMASTICWATLPGSMKPFWPMAGIS